MIYFENLYLGKINLKDLGLIFAFIVLILCLHSKIRQLFFN